MRLTREIVRGFDANEQPVWLVIEEFTLPSVCSLGDGFRFTIRSEADLLRLAARDKEEYGITASVWTMLLGQIEMAKRQAKEQS